MVKKDIVINKDFVEIQMQRSLVELLLDNISNTYTVKGIEGAKVLIMA